MKPTTELHDLLDAVESARAELHPALPVGLLRDVITIEERYAENPEVALGEVRRLVDDLLSNKGRD